MARGLIIPPPPLPPLPLSSSQLAGHPLLRVLVPVAVPVARQKRAYSIVLQQTSGQQEKPAPERQLRV